MCVGGKKRWISYIDNECPAIFPKAIDFLCLKNFCNTIQNAASNFLMGKKCCVHLCTV